MMRKGRLMGYAPTLEASLGTDGIASVTGCGYDSTKGEVTLGLTAPSGVSTTILYQVGDLDANGCVPAWTVMLWEQGSWRVRAYQSGVKQHSGLVAETTLEY